MFLVYDQMDPGHEFATYGSLRLPGIYGLTDIPLILTDKLFCATADGRTELFQEEGRGAGRRQVDRERHDPAQVHRPAAEVPLPDPEHGPGQDLGPQPHQARRNRRARWSSSPPTRTSWQPRHRRRHQRQRSEHPAGALRVSVAERYDVIIDFAQFPAGSKLYLRENAAAVRQRSAAAQPGAQGLAIANVLLQFDVVNRESWFPPDTPPIPADPHAPIPRCRRRSARSHGSSPATRPGSGTEPPCSASTSCLRREPGRPLHPAGTTEEWLLDNNANVPGGPSAWTHPVHIHFEEFRVLKRFVRDRGAGGERGGTRSAADGRQKRRHATRSGTRAP